MPKRVCRICRGVRESIVTASGEICTGCGSKPKKPVLLPDERVVHRCNKCTSLYATVSERCLVCSGCGAVSGYRGIE